MAYLRVKWIKGNPYLYEQESYREGDRVRTRHLRYISRQTLATTGEGAGHRRLVNPQRQRDIDSQFERLELASEYPFEAGLLAECLYQNSIPLRVAEAGYTKVAIEGEGAPLKICESFNDYLLGGHQRKGELILFSHASPFTWMYTLGKTLVQESQILTHKMDSLLSEYINQIKLAHKQAIDGSYEAAESFIATFGELMDVRKIYSPDIEGVSTSYLFPDKQYISSYLEKVRVGQASWEEFRNHFSTWVVPKVRFAVEEMFAVGTAALMMGAKKAFEIFADEGKRVLTELYPLAYEFYLEMNFLVTGTRERKSKRKTRTRRQRSRVRAYKPILFYPGNIVMDDKVKRVLNKRENNEYHNALAYLMYRHSTLPFYSSIKVRRELVQNSHKRNIPIVSTCLLEDKSAVHISTINNTTTITLL